MQKRALVAVMALATAFAAPAEAQLVNGKWQAPAKSGGSTGTGPQKGVEVRKETPAAKPTSVTVVPLRVIHAVVMSDGGVYADFGTGLELVRTTCPISMSTTALQVWGTFPDTTANRPLPSQFTPQQRAASKEAAQASCHVRDSQGKVFAVR